MSAFDRRLVLVNYAHNGYARSQATCTESALGVGGVDQVFALGRDDLDPDFRIRADHVLRHERGAGWWCWKPQVILQTLDRLGPNDVLLYCDSGWSFHSSARILLPLLEDHDMVVTEAIPRIEGMETGYRTLLTDCKRFCLDHYGLGPDSPEVHRPLQSGGFIAMNNSDDVREFMQRWRDDMISDLLMVDDRFDDPHPEYSGFMRHMNDMGPLNCLLASHGRFISMSRDARQGFHARLGPREIDYEWVAPARRGIG